MRTAMRPRYYCDHCKKGTGSPSYMRRHETGCTANPNRVCGMCGRNGDVERHAKTLTAPGNTLLDWQGKMAELRDLTDNCPACVLAAIRKSGVQKMDAPEDPAAGGEYRDPHADMSWKAINGAHAMLGFDWKAEKDSWNDEHPRDDGNHY